MLSRQEPPPAVAFPAPMNPEQQARAQIDRLLASAGWHVCDVAGANLHAARGVAIREFPIDPVAASPTTCCMWTGSDNLPPPEVIAQEIVDDLEAALEQFRLIAADLNGSDAGTG